MRKDTLLDLIREHIFLPGGWNLVNFKFQNNTWNSGIVVLCEKEGNVMPYVTWRIDDNGFPFSGNYFEDIEGAGIDLDQRCW